MEYKLECPGFFLRTETCTGPVNRFDAAALAPERQTLALEGLPMAASVRLLGLLAPGIMSQIAKCCLDK